MPLDYLWTERKGNIFRLVVPDKIIGEKKIFFLNNHWAFTFLFHLLSPSINDSKQSSIEHLPQKRRQLQIFLPLSKHFTFPLSSFFFFFCHPSLTILSNLTCLFLSLPLCLFQVTHWFLIKKKFQWYNLKLNFIFSYEKLPGKSHFYVTGRCFAFVFVFFFILRL